MLGQSMNRTNKSVSITATQSLAGRLPVGRPDGAAVRMLSSTSIVG